MLVNKCRIQSKDSQTKSAHYKSVSENKSENKNRGKPYRAPIDKGKQNFQHKATCGKEASRGATPAAFICFKYGEEMVHHANKHKITSQKSFKCMNQGHRVTECKIIFLTCYNHGEPCYIITQCQKPKKAQSSGNIFALSNADVLKLSNLIRGTCIMNNVRLIAIVDTSVMNLFTSLDCVKWLNLKAFSMINGMVIDKSANGSVTTTLVCLNCPLIIYG